ncbi:ComF family protein [Streptomyces litchfieldiae]|uniref:Phosphoribosyltransferase family protein n=1 Tax=Streptomyces litchfieldiae TaxID=3075543 RepID=A0ABU2MN52_9ACTN|nr:phosphoribosyltransferase family protein [Streptomyces sp. DSM 44938]MDT0343041.1 phosphoribosyltransferase family protein [Streptomyces sp. DSM 44938]
MRGWWRELGSLVLPTACAGCGAGREVLCEACRRAVCAGPARRVRPVPEPVGLPPVYAATGYADQPRAVLLAHKERGMLALAAPLGRALAVSVRAVAPAAGAGRAVGLVPVPSTRAAVARRGHDPVRRIALAAARRLRAEGRAVQVRPALRMTRVVADQAGLTAAERRANLAGALAVRPGALRPGDPVLLVDDLVTTGASLTEAARAVTAAGGTVLGAAVVAGPSFEWSYATRR